MREIILETERLYLSPWAEDDFDLAKQLWENPFVTKFITKKGIMELSDIEARFQEELTRQNEFGIAYFPLFEKETNNFIGVSGLRPYDAQTEEFGIHMLPKYQGKGYAREIGIAIIEYAKKRPITKLFAGHHPQNTSSKRLLEYLGYVHSHDEFYEPTGLLHPSYYLKF